MTPPDELTRLRSALTAILIASDGRARVIAAEALGLPPVPLKQYEEARTLADLDPHAWRIVARQTDEKHGYIIPYNEIDTFRRLRAEGLITSAQARRGAQTLILARRLRDVPEARPVPRRRTSVAAP
jgi:hypothetical protein